MSKKQTFLLQTILSFAALYACFYEVDWSKAQDLLYTISVPMLVLAIVIKSIGLIVREIRLWIILDSPRPSFYSTVYVGLAAGLMHTFLPFRGGDILSIAMLHKYCGLQTSQASVAVGICAFFEMLIFALFLFILVLVQPYWYTILGENLIQQTLGSTSVIIVVGLIAIIIFAMLGKKHPNDDVEKPKEASAIHIFFQQLFSYTHKAVARKKLVFQLTISTLEIVMMISSFVLALHAMGIVVDAPFGTVAIILGFSAIAAVALPPSYGAGPGAAIAFVFTLLHLSDEQALTYAGLWWLLSQIPTLITGLPSFWMIRKRE